MFNSFKTKPSFKVSIFFINKPKLNKIEMNITETQYKKMLLNLYKRFDISHHIFSLAPDLGILTRLEAEAITGFKSSQPIISNEGLLAYDAYNLFAKNEDIYTSNEDAEYLIQAFPKKLLLKNMKSYRISEAALPNTKNTVCISIKSLRLFHV